MLVKFFATYRTVTGLRRLELEAPQDVLALMHVLSDRWPEFRPLLLNEAGDGLGDDVIIMVNGRHIEHLDGMNTKLTESDSVAVTPLVAGG